MQAKQKDGCFFCFLVWLLFNCLVCFFWLDNIKRPGCDSQVLHLSLSAAKAPSAAVHFVNARTHTMPRQTRLNEYGPSLSMSVHMVMSVHVGEPVLV